jgi:hypothetical protein
MQAQKILTLKKLFSVMMPDVWLDIVPSNIICAYVCVQQKYDKLPQEETMCMLEESKTTSTIYPLDHLHF